MLCRCNMNKEVCDNIILTETQLAETQLQKHGIKIFYLAGVPKNI